MNAARSSQGPAVFALHCHVARSSRSFGGQAPRRQQREEPNRRTLQLITPRASGDFGLVDGGGWEGDAFEHFPDVMPYRVPSMAWSAKRKRLRTRESKVWQEEMDNLKSKWAKFDSSSTSRSSDAEPTHQREEEDSYEDEWSWCAHADAVRSWEQQKNSWSQDRLRAFQVAQQRLDSFRSQQQQSSYAQAQSYRQGAKANDPLGFYAALGLHSSASLSEIKSAFREAVFENHPDVSRASETDERMKMLLNAYQVLKDDSKRHLYDTQGVC